MKFAIVLILLLPAWCLADVLDDDYDEGGYQGPEKSQIELIEVKETSPYGSSNPFKAKIKNNSQFYLDRLSLSCTVTDQRGHRVFKELIFKSKPIMSVRFGFPPIKTPEAGIPPGATAEMELYTDDNRWTRGNGAYKYDCRIYGVSGQS